MPSNATAAPYTGQTVTRASDRCLNWTPERGGEALIFRPRRGLAREKTLATGGATVRGLYATAAGTDMYAINGTKIYRASDSFTTAVGMTLTPATGHVQMADNGTYVVIGCKSTGVGSRAIAALPGTATAFDITSTLAPGIPAPPTAIRFVGGYLVAIGAANAGAFFWSQNTAAGAAAAYTWPALNYATAQSCPDGAVALEVLHNQLYVGGTRTLEVWDLTGDNTYVFAPVSGAPLTVGVVGPHAIAATTQAVYWIATTQNGQPAVYRSLGYNAERISTPLIDNYLQGWFSIYSKALGAADVTAVVENADGHSLVIFAGSDASADGPALCYDETTGLWSERSTLLSAVQSPLPWRCHAFYATLHYWGGDNSAALFSTQTGATTDDSSIPITRLRAWPEVVPSLSQTRWDQLEALFGTGLAFTATATWSDDQWATSKTQTASVGGGLGRANWQRLGLSRSRDWQISAADINTAPSLLSVDLRAQVGRT